MSENPISPSPEQSEISTEKGTKPWEDPIQYIPNILKEWEGLKEGLNQIFSKREDQHVSEQMKKGIGCFYRMLYWSNDLPVDLQQTSLRMLSIKPVNLEERLQYVLSRPSKYQSFVQLGELFIELEKLFYKKEQMKKTSKP